ncbi:MAG: hypothetical protein JNK00_08105, partial [Flavipsychrobacter sp.]|nr:hypothetical protein [Flavipsychrobacter sp.]
MTFSFYKWFKNLSLVFAFAFASNAAQAQYCNTGLYTTACFWGDQIEAFATTGGTTNISNWYSGCGNSSGYTYYSTQTVTIAAGGTVGISILNNYYYGQYYKVWVDFNGDGDFYDSGEQLYSAYLNYYAFVSSSFVVPNGTTPGTKRLRVRCSYYGTSSMDPCAQETYGEVEDYNLVVTGSAACSGTPAPGNTISTANPVCAGTSFTLSLQNTTSGSGVSYQWQSSPNNTTWTNVSGATANTLSTTQTASTYYRCAVTCSSNTGFSNSLQVTMNNFLNCYCVAGNSNGCGFSDVITNVTFGTINNTTGCTATPAYIDYGGSVAAPNITIGATTPISVTVGPGGTERVAAWIDYNQNGIFETTEYTSIGSGNGVTISNNITVPGTALPGTTKMRVRVRYNTTIASNEACSTFSYGETEDYNLNMICVSPTITAHPASTSFCSGANTSFTATATGSAISYQWQVNTGSGYTNIANGGVYGGATASTLSLTAPPASFSGYTYRCVATAACNSATATTSDATLTIAATTAVTAPPTNTTVCPGANTTLTVGAVGSSLTYQWQIGTPSGGAYYNLT